MLWNLSIKWSKFVNLEKYNGNIVLLAFALILLPNEKRCYPLFRYEHYITAYLNYTFFIDYLCGRIPMQCRRSLL